MDNIKSQPIPTEDYLDIQLTMAGIRLPDTSGGSYQIAFRILLSNSSELSVRLLGRKWILRDNNGQTRLIEADGIFNQHPLLQPGDVFAYTGRHTFTEPPTHMEVMFFGLNQAGFPFISPSFIFPKKTYQAGK